MKIWKLNLLALAATLFWWVVAYFFVCNLRIAGSFLQQSEIQIVNDLFIFKIIQPEWLGPDYDGLMMDWFVREYTTRLLIAFTGWIASLLFINHFIRKQKRKSNKTLEYSVATAPHP